MKKVGNSVHPDAAPAESEEAPQDQPWPDSENVSFTDKQVAEQILQGALIPAANAVRDVITDGPPSARSSTARWLLERYGAGSGSDGDVEAFLADLVKPKKE